VGWTPSGRLAPCICIVRANRIRYKKAEGDSGGDAGACPLMGSGTREWTMVAAGLLCM